MVIAGNEKTIRRLVMRKGWKRWLAAAVSAVLLAAMVASAGTVSRAEGGEEEVPVETGGTGGHGTSTTEITEDMLKNTPPEDYQVDMSMQADAKDGAYDAYFLKDGIQTVSIKVDENNLNYLLQNADKKPSVMTESVTIGDKTIGYTGLKTKGSYTLEHAFMDNFGNDRFSFTVNFGKFIKKSQYGVKQNFYGCRKVSFNNFFFDKSMLKEYIALALMTEMGVPTPQYGLAKLYINDNFYGVYFMVEAMDQSIIEQYQKADKGGISDYLVKPEHTSLLYDEKMDKYRREDGTFDLNSVLELDENGIYKAKGDLKEQETLWEEDDETLQDVAEMLPTVLSWQKKINQLSSGKDFDGKAVDVNSDAYLELLNQVMDVDEVVRYFAAHSFLVQIDNMFDGQKNYGLYVDTSGKCMVVPWDYDLSFGCYFPSTSEATANLELDIMFNAYKDQKFGFGGAGKKPGEIYKEFPLFYVIYQNKSLMDKYHQYMKDCAKIAALGGTAFNGKTYEPCWFNSLIQNISEPLVTAASEKLADNVSYMNFINQPSGTELGQPNLSKIIAMRSVAVAAQVDGVETTVSGYGCNLETLGNGAVGENTNRGVLTAVEAVTGIHATADYGLQESTVKPPMLTVRALGKKEEIYKTFRDKTGASGNGLVVYNITNTADPEGDYTLSIPLSGERAKRGAEIYAYTEKDGVKKLDAAVDDNIYRVTTPDIQYIAVISSGGLAARIFTNPIVYIAAGVIVLLAAGFLVFKKYRKPRTEKRK